MLRQALPLALLTIASLMPTSAHADDKLKLTSVNVDLPFGERMFQGPGSEAVNNNCLACHSAGMVLTQPALSKEQWHGEVDRLQGADRSQGCRNARCTPTLLARADEVIE